MNNPLINSILTFVNSCIEYLSTGIKNGVLNSALIVILSYQFFIKRIKISNLIILIPLSLILLATLVGTTSFRAELGLDSFLRINTQSMIISLKEFISGAESNHIIYTSYILNFLEDETTNIRYGFDYWRIYLYPIKHLLYDYEYASYNQFAHLVSGKKLNAGLYLGLAGELFWNFGYLFFLFSFLHGLILKKFTNWAFSGKLFGIMAYLLLINSVLWHLYRGSANALMQSILFFLPGYFLFVFSYKYIMNKKYISIRKLFIRIRKVY